MTHTKYIQDVCEKTGLSKEEVTKDWHAKMEEAKREFPDLEGAALNTRAVNKFLSYYRKMLQSQAHEWTGYVVGYDDANDRFSNKKRKAAQAYAADKAKAIADGFVDQNGTPLETKRESKNFGLPIRPFIARSVYGVCLTKGKPAKKFSLLITADDVNRIPVPPLSKLIKFRARIKADEPDIYVLNNVPETKFEDQVDEKVPSLDIIVQKFYKPMSDISKAEQNNDFIYECIIQSLDLESSSGSKRLTVAPENMDLDTPPITVFMPRQYNFAAVAGLAEGVKAMIFGRMGGTKEDGSSVINGYGVWVYPDYRPKKTAVEMKKEEIPEGGW